MKLTIVFEDRVVCKDTLCYRNFDMSGVPQEVHALQWDTSLGHIEYKNTNNEVISALPSWALDLVTQWESKDYDEKNPPPPTKEQIQQNNANDADLKLQASDWTVLPDVRLVNKTAWVTYRNILRSIRAEPPSVVYAFPEAPPVIWE